MTQQIYDITAAEGYERAFARVSSHFLPYLLATGRVMESQEVLDVATGTGLAAAAALAAVGPSGHVTAVDISSSMVEQARKRLGKTSPGLISADARFRYAAQFGFGRPGLRRKNRIHVWTAPRLQADR